MTTKNANKTDLVVWDLPTRVFHWLMAAAFIAAWVISENDRFLYHHVFAGYVFIGLIVFRFVWGMVGSHYARFRSFAYDWPSVTAYLKGLISGEAARHVGHNPAGSWAIFAMLVFGVVISISGLLTLGGEEGHGPLKGLVSYDVGEMAKEIHEVATDLMLGLVVLHLLGVIVESIFHRENLIWAMISGRKPAADDAVSVHVYPLVAVIILGTISGAAVYYFHGYFTQTKDRPFLAFTRDPLPDNELWRSECGDCHLAFHPVLLPARSWQRMMDEQDDHFGEDLSLDEADVAEITDFLVHNASETGLTEPAHKVTKSVPPDQAPLRLTETNYWKHKHEEIEDVYWKSPKVKSKVNCAACHRDAKQGWFEDSNMELPELEK